MPTEKKPSPKEKKVKKNKEKKTKNTKNKNVSKNPVRNWGELKELGFLTLVDIQRPHQVLDSIMLNYKELIEGDQELYTACNGLGKSYFDCLDELLRIMSTHVISGDFPLTHQEVIENPSRFQNAVFKTGKVGDGLSESEEDLAYIKYHDIETQYQYLAHKIYSLSNKVMLDIEMRISSKYNHGRKPEEIKQDEESFKQFSNDLKSMIQSKEQILNMKRERIEESEGENNG